jgi:hypothetical protein
MVIAAALLGIASSLGAGSASRVEVQATATVRILAGERLHFSEDPQRPKDRRQHGSRKLRETQLVIDGTMVPASLYEFE